MNLKSQHYQVAYRRVEQNFERFPLDIHLPPFKLIPNTWRYWAADPFLFEEGGNIYIFCELYDFILRRGVIGYSEWLNDRFTSWCPIIVEPFHMSYPLVFRHKNQIYMIPETFQSGELRLYKAAEFPHKWFYYKTIKINCSLVDTTITPDGLAGGGVYWIYSFDFRQNSLETTVG